jgi:AcrR family transcriptional regulator
VSRIRSRPPTQGTRDRIVATALRLFSEQGTSATGMREIADAAGVTVPGLYYHFASKAELLQAVFETRGLVVLDERDASAEPELPPTLESRLRERAQREFDGLVANADVLRLVHRESTLGDADAQAFAERLRTNWRAQWRVALGGASDLAREVDLDAACDCITTFLWGLFVEFLARDDPTVAERIPSFAALVAPTLTRSR